MRNVAQFAIAMVILPLAGCGATSAQVQFHSDAETIKKAMADVNACGALVASAPKYAPLKAHMNISGKEPSVAELADNSMISPEDADLVSQYQTSIGQCDQQFANELSSISPRLSEIVMDAHAAHNENTANLIDHKETWGEFNKRQQYIGSSAIKEIVQTLDQISNALNQENQFEIQQRAQAWENFQRAMQRQEMINSINQPRTTNCSKFGITISCTTE